MLYLTVFTFCVNVDVPLPVVVEPWSAIIIGFFAGCVYLLVSKLLIILRLDDAVDAIPVHLGGGVLGMIGVGLFASPKRLEAIFGNSDHPGLLYSIFSPLEEFDSSLLGAQVVGTLFVIAWTVGIMLPFFIFLDYKGLFRAEVAVEIAGLDQSFHGGIQDGLVAQTEETFVALEKKLTRHRKSAT